MSKPLNKLPKRSIRIKQMKKAERAARREDEASESNGGPCEQEDRVRERQNGAQDDQNEAHNQERQNEAQEEQNEVHEEQDEIQEVQDEAQELQQPHERDVVSENSLIAQHSEGSYASRVFRCIVLWIVAAVAFVWALVWCYSPEEVPLADRVSISIFISFILVAALFYTFRTGVLRRPSIAPVPDQMQMQQMMRNRENQDPA